MPQKRIRTIPPTIQPVNVYSTQYICKRVAAYCRVSTKQEEQLNSYEVQVKYYTERINRENGWQLAGIYADKGITGTSTRKRDEFNKMIKACRRHKVDMIITKSDRMTVFWTVFCGLFKILSSVFISCLEQKSIQLQIELEFSYSIFGEVCPRYRTRCIRQRMLRVLLLCDTHCGIPVLF